jgi:hypothetical protein
MEHRVAIWTYVEVGLHIWAFFGKCLSFDISFALLTLIPTDPKSQQPWQVSVD